MNEHNKKVMHLLPSLEVGGMERLVCDLVSNRDRSSTSVVCLHKLGSLGEQLPENIEVKVLSASENTLKAIFTVYREILRQKPDVIHCHNMQAHFFGALCSKMSPFPCRVVLSKHGQYVPMVGTVAKLNLKLLKSTYVVGVSSEIKDIMSALPVRYRHQVMYIPNGLSLEKYNNSDNDENIRDSLGLDPSHVVVGMVSRLAVPKDHVILLRAMVVLKEKYDKLRLLIVGEGQKRAELENFIHNNGLRDRVILLGERKDIPDILKCLDIFALTSSSEGIPMTILEAMAAKLPVIATRVGGIPCVVKERETGLLVTDKDEAELRTALSVLIDSEAERDRLGLEGRKQIESKYSISATLKKYESVYND